MFKYFLFFLLTLEPLNSWGLPPIFMKLGTSQKIPVPTTHDIRITNSSVLKAIDLDDHIRIIGKKSGETDILMGKHSRKVFVLPPVTFDHFFKIKKFLRGRLGLRVEINNKSPIIYGELHRWSDWYSLSRLSLPKKGLPFEFKAKVDPDIKKEIIDYFRNELSNANLPFPSIELGTHNKINVQKKLKKYEEQWKSLFHPFGLKVIYVKSNLLLDPLVRVQIVVAEISHGLTRSLGVRWQGQYKAQIVPKLAGTEPLSMTLNALEDSGKGQILAAPRLLTRSGTRAQFLAGGEFPIRLASEHTASVTWKKHGILLEVKPIADWAGQVSIEITSEISMINTSQSVDGVPGLKTNRIKTHFDLKSGNTIALSGLIKNTLGRSNQSIPYLSKIPIIGSLFESENFIQQKSELIVFVTPTVVSPSTHQPLALPKGWNYDQ